MNHLLFHHHTREQLNELAKIGYAVVIPLAATEQHGPYLPVHTDSLICEHVSYRSVELATKRFGVPLLLAPMLAVGCSHHHLHYGGTLSFSSETYLQMLKELGKSLIDSGFRKIIYLNAHGGNEYAMHQAAQDLAVAYPVWTASASYWSAAREALQAANAAEIGFVPGHAGSFEASLMLALQEDLVRVEETTANRPHPHRPWIASGRPGTFVGRHGELTGIDGYTDSLQTTDAVKGRRYLETIVAAVADWLNDVSRTMQFEAEMPHE